jgi:predicted transcriptional regulator
VVTANQWQRSSRNVGYAAAEAGSVAEAEKLLDEIEKK